jgi:hypothetical protein
VNRFKLGQVVATPGALAALEASGVQLRFKHSSVLATDRTLVRRPYGRRAGTNVSNRGRVGVKRWLR